MASFREIASPQNPEAEKLQSYPGFDWLRFALASIVQLDHSGVRFLSFLDGGVAVKVFFALSGWLIGGILLKSKVADMPRFFFNRSTRIWIPYAVAIFLLYAVAALKDGIDYFWFKYLFLDLTFTHQIYTIWPAAQFELPMNGSGNQFWSISVEEQFYLMAPIVMLFLGRGRSLTIWLPIALVTTALDVHAASVSWGVCAAILQHDLAIAERLSVRVAAAGVAVLAAVVMTCMGNAYIAGPIFAIAVVLALAIPGKRSRLAVIAGGLSYPLYLNQWLPGFVVNFVDKHWLPLSKAVSILSVYTLCVIMGLILYWIVDRPIQIYRHRWYSPALGKRLGVIAYSAVAIGLVGGAAMHFLGQRGG